MLELGIFGCSGRMGLAIISALLNDNNWKLVSTVTHPGSSSLGKSLTSMLPHAPDLEITDRFSVLPPQVWIDFSIAAATPIILKEALKTRTPLLIGATGHANEIQQQIKDASHEIPILYAANTSIGINLLLSLVSIAAKTLGLSADVEIHETHHRLKRDAPSGTALTLAKAVAAAREQAWPQAMQLREADLLRSPATIGMASSGAGNIPGEHRVLFAIEDELLELRHFALNRSIFAKGALVGAKWLSQQKPGLYTMQQALGLLI